MRAMTTLLWLGVVAFGAAAAAEQAPADRAARTQQINEELARLAAETPIAMEIAELQAKQRESDQQRSAEHQEIQRQITELRRRPEWTAYQERRTLLQRELRELGQAEVAALTAAGRELFESRHAALRQRARTELVEGRALGLDVLSYPRVDGSTSTHPLSVILASRLLDVPYEWLYTPATGGVRFEEPSPEQIERWRRQGQATLPPDPSDPADGRERGGRLANIELNLAASRVYAQADEDADSAQQRIARMINSLLANHTDTHNAHIRLIIGQADLILVARAPSASELKLAEDRGVTLVATPVARDALVFIVNRANDVESLTQDQLREIYFGRIQHWSAVGATVVNPPTRTALRPGLERPILPLRRERDSGSRELFDELLMKGEQLPDPRDRSEQTMFEVLSMGGPFNRISVEPESLGYTVYYYEQFMSMSPRTRRIAVDGVAPTPQTIASGEYPFVSDVYAVHREGEPADSPAMRLLAWLLSEEGQAVVAESGYVPVRQ